MTTTNGSVLLPLAPIDPSVWDPDPILSVSDQLEPKIQISDGSARPSQSNSGGTDGADFSISNFDKSTADTTIINEDRVKNSDSAEVDFYEPEFATTTPGKSKTYPFLK